MASEPFAIRPEAVRPAEASNKLEPNKSMETSLETAMVRTMAMAMAMDRFYHLPKSRAMGQPSKKQCSGPPQGRKGGTNLPATQRTPQEAPEEEDPFGD